MGVRTVGRYTLHGELAAGGMATVHFGRLRGPVQFTRTVAIKQLLPQFASDADFVVMFVDEARLASRIRHPNVVPTLDVVTEGSEIFIVMDYVHGETLARLLRTCSEQNVRVPPRIACAIVRDMLNGLQAAHDAKDENGGELRIVHRDVSPQNTLVGTDGVTRLLDFGIAKARGRSQVTREGQVKGKLGYMAPEQLLGKPITRSVDIFAAAVVLWETLVGRRLFQAESEGHVVQRIISVDAPPPSEAAPELGDRFDAVLAKGLARDSVARFASAREFAQALTQVETPAEPIEVGEWVARTAAGTLAWRTDRLREVERDATLTDPDGTVARADELTRVEAGSSDGATVIMPSVRSTEATPRPARRAGIMVAAIALVVAVGLAATRARSRDVAAAAPPVGADTAATTPPTASEPSTMPIVSPSVSPVVGPTETDARDAAAIAPKPAGPRPTGRPPKPKASGGTFIPDRL